MMKRKLLATILAALALAALSGFSLGDKGMREYYTGLLREGVITKAEFAKLEQYDFELPESEKIPLDDFTIGEITQGADGSVVSR